MTSMGAIRPHATAQQRALPTEQHVILHVPEHVTAWFEQVIELIETDAFGSGGEITLLFDENGRVTKLDVRDQGGDPHDPRI
jgi:hypothetical protein